MSITSTDINTSTTIVPPNTFLTGTDVTLSIGLTPNTSITSTGITSPTNGKMASHEIIKVTTVATVATLLLLILLVVILHLFKKLYKKKQKANSMKKKQNTKTQKM